MMIDMEDVYMIPQKSTFEIQDFTYVYLFNEEGKVEVRSFNPIERFQRRLCDAGFPGGYDNCVEVCNW